MAWRSAGEAQAAAQVVGTDPAFADFRASITGITSMEHYSTEDRRFIGQF